MNPGAHGRPAPRRAVLMRHQQVGIGDVSRTGCRLEASEPLSPGAVGMLVVDIEGQIHVEFFRVSRTVRCGEANDRYESGVEFLPMPADMPSLHDFAVQLEQSHS